MKDNIPRYVPESIICKMQLRTVTDVIAHPPHSHAGIIDSALTAVEIQTEAGSRWYGFDKAWINSELRMVVQGFDSRDEVRSKWQIAKRF